MLNSPPRFCANLGRRKFGREGQIPEHSPAQEFWWGFSDKILIITSRPKFLAAQWPVAMNVTGRRVCHEQPCDARHVIDNRAIPAQTSNTLGTPLAGPPRSCSYPEGRLMCGGTALGPRISATNLKAIFQTRRPTCSPRHPPGQHPVGPCFSQSKSQGWCRADALQCPMGHVSPRRAALH